MNFYRYFQSNEDYFWRWEENSEVIAIPGGSTIAYRDFLLQILQNLAEQGIPPFGSLLLAIAATNSTSKRSILHIKTIAEDLIKKTEAKNKERLNNTLTEAISFLNILESLPQQYKEGKLRSYLFQTVFASCHNILSTSNSKNVLRTYNSKTYENEKLTANIKANLDLFHKDFSTISLLLKKFPDGGAIINAIASIPEINEKVDLPQEPSSPDAFQKDFVQALIDNSKTYHVGILIKRIWTGLKIPYHHSLPSELPLGGISDIANKGDFDKLLISEFANDDLILLSRLANNEALYLRREMPPVTDTTQRIILIDVSLKNWGTPKILAYAILLAIAKHPKTDINCLAYAIGNSFTPIVFSEIEEVINSFAIMDTCLHPTTGLEAFFKINSNPKVLEIFLITSAETARLPEMQKALSNYNVFFKYFIITSSNGNIELFKNQQKSKKLLQSITINLKEAWAFEPKTKASQKASSDCPILFPRQNFIKILNTSDDQFFVITKDKKLFRILNNDLNTNKKGLEEILSNLIMGEFDIGIIDNGHTVLFCCCLNSKELVFTNLNTKEILKHSFDDNKHFPSFFFYNGDFHCVDRNNHWKLKYNDPIEINKSKIIPDYENAKNKRKEELLNLARLYRHNNTPLKNINNIYINQVNNLVINNLHELIKLQNGIIKIQRTDFLESKLTAKLISKEEFVFSDGSSVKINRSGMMMLISSNPDIPCIYIPTSLDCSLGIGTNEQFAGHEFYYNENSGLIKTSTENLWKNTVEQFISNVLTNATTPKTIS